MWHQALGATIEAHKYKGRIVYRGDLIRNEADEIVLYADTATTP